MSKSISDALLATFQLPNPPIAICIKITRVDGAIFTFTTIDRQLAFNGLVYQPLYGLKPTAIKETSDLSVGTVDFDGIISSNAITDTDLGYGLYRDAEILITKVDFTAMPSNPANPPTSGEFIQTKGYVGKISIKEDVYQIEVNLIENKLSIKQGKKTQINCWTDFCSPECTLNEATYTFDDTIKTVSNQTSFTVNGSYGASVLSFGKVYIVKNGIKFTQGIKQHLVISGTSDLTIRGGFPFEIIDGMAIQLVRGCGKALANCKTYKNVVNFRGFPYVPTNQVIIQIAHPPFTTNALKGT